MDNFNYNSFRNSLRSHEFNVIEDRIVLEKINGSLNHKFTIHYLDDFRRVEVYQSYGDLTGHIEVYVPSLTRTIHLTKEEIGDLLNLIEDRFENGKMLKIERTLEKETYDTLLKALT